MPEYQPTSVNLDRETIERLGQFSDAHGYSTLRGPNLSAAIRKLAELYSFNDACTQLGVTGDREAFHAYWVKVRDAKDERHTLDVWRIVYRCFEDSRDSQDERDTQRDALI